MRQRVQRLIENGVMQVVAVTDPLMLGFTLQAMIGVEADGDLRAVADQAGQGRRDRLRRDHLGPVRPAGRGRVRATTSSCSSLVNDVIRALPGVRAAEVFTYLHLEKQTYSWGTG